MSVHVKLRSLLPHNSVFLKLKIQEILSLAKYRMVVLIRLSIAVAAATSGGGTLVVRLERV